MPRVSRVEVDRRRERLARLLCEEHYLPVTELARRLEVSEVTARRDLAALDRADRVRRTHGGALPTELEAGEYDGRFASFDARRRVAAPAKAALARAAHAEVRAGDVVFVDAGTTCYRLAEELRRVPVQGVRVVTQSLAVASLLAGPVEVTLTGGRLLPRQQTLVGPAALATVAATRIDRAFLAAQSFGPEGLANTQEDVVDLQRAVLRSVAAVGGISAWLMHAGKLAADAPHPVASWDEVDRVLTDAPPRDLAALPAGRTVSVSLTV